MTAEEYAGYAAHLNTAYAQEMLEAGAFTDLAAARRSEQSQAELLPDGVDTPGHQLWSAYDGETPVGDPLGRRGRADGLHLRHRGP